MSWLWKDKGQGKTQLKFSTKNKPGNLVHNKIKVTLELDMEYPEDADIVEVIRNIQTSFDLPMGVEMHDALLSHIEIQGAPHA